MVMVIYTEIWKNEKISKRLTEVWRSTHKGKKEEVLDKENSWWKEDF